MLDLSCAGTGSSDDGRQQDLFVKLGIGDWILDAASYRLTRGAEERVLQPKECGVLQQLAEAAPAAVSTEALLANCWNGTVVGDNALHRVVSNLRHALGDDTKHPRYIETLPRSGYRLLAEVRSIGVPSRATPTLAILPMRCADAAHRAFAEGLTDQLQAQFSRIDGVRLIARTSANRVRGEDLDAYEIGRTLRADYLIEGSVQRAATRIRIHMSLVNAANAAVLLSRSYDRDLPGMTALFALYDDITADITAKLAEFIGTHPGRPARQPPPTQSMIAYELLRAGFAQLSEHGNPALLIEYAERALQLDPAYPSAQVARLEGIFNQAERGIAPAKERYGYVRAQVLDMLEQVPGNWGALYLLGRLHAVLDLHFPRAIAAFDAAEQLGMPMPEVAVWRAALLFNSGRTRQALHVITEAEALDPLHPSIKDIRARCHHLLGEHGQSVRCFDAMLALQPNNRFNTMIAVLYGVRSQDAQRIASLIELHGSGEHGARWEWDYARAALANLQGDPEPMRAFARAAVDNRGQRYVHTSAISHAFHCIRDFEQHMRWLAVREANCEVLHFVPTSLNYPDYWQTLEDWTNAEPDLRDARRALLQEHRLRVARITRNMVLP